MVRDKKIYTHSSFGGIAPDKENGASYVKNMINENGANIKRPGHKNICQITDSSFAGLRINGIFDYSYIDTDGNAYTEKIIHAGDKLFKASADFKSIKEIEIPNGITLKDERTKAIPSKDGLFIIGASGVLIYNGKEIKGIYENENVYIPNTTIIDKEGKGESKESPNVLTTQRINTFVGTTHFRDSGATNVFLLDGNLKYGTDFLMEIKIRTRTSEEEPDETTSSYIGVDSLGVEVNRIVTIRYARKNLSKGSFYFLTEPIRDESGNVINLKIGEEIYTYDKLTFGMSVRNGREVRVSLDMPSPIKGEANVFVKYFSLENGERALLEKAKIAISASGERGGEIMLLNFGDNKIYFTDEKRGFFYLPTKNKISLGSDGEKISAIVKLSDNLVGAFKKNSFYRIKFTSSSNDGYEIISSTDLVGAYSIFSTSFVDYDCLVLNDLGVYGVSEYKSTSNVFNCLRPRGNAINRFLSKYSSKEMAEAQSISYKSRYYLFIGGDAYIADTTKKHRKSGAESDAYEYEWWIWDNCPARVLYSDGNSLYFGTEKGEICKFTDNLYDVTEKEYSNSGLSLLLNDKGAYTEFVIPNAAEIDLSISRVRLSSHKRLLSRGALYDSGLFYLDSSDVFFSDGSVKLYTGDRLAIYNDEGNLVLESEIKDVDIILKTVEPQSNDGLKVGEMYDIYACQEDTLDYEISMCENGVALLWNNEKIKITNEPIIFTLREIKPIECVYKTEPMGFDRPLNYKTLYNLFLKLTNSARGEIVVCLESEKSTLEKRIFIGEPISFDELGFDKFAFNAPFKSTQLVRSFLRNFENLTVEIKSKGKEAFGIEGISFIYLAGQKMPRIK